MLWGRSRERPSCPSGPSGSASSYPSARAGRSRSTWPATRLQAPACPPGPSACRRHRAVPGIGAMRTRCIPPACGEGGTVAIVTGRRRRSKRLAAVGVGRPGLAPGEDAVPAANANTRPASVAGCWMGGRGSGKCSRRLLMTRSIGSPPQRSPCPPALLLDLLATPLAALPRTGGPRRGLGLPVEAELPVGLVFAGSSPRSVATLEAFELLVQALHQ